MSYETVATWSQLTAMALFIALFVIVLIYTFRRKNAATFERAARAPLDDAAPSAGARRS